MKIISKKGRTVPTGEVREIDVEVDHFGIIIIDDTTLTPDEIKKAEEAVREIRRQIDNLQDVLDSGWYNLRKD